METECSTNTQPSARAPLAWEAVKGREHILYCLRLQGPPSKCCSRGTAELSATGWNFLSLTAAVVKALCHSTKYRFITIIFQCQVCDYFRLFIWLDCYLPKHLFMSKQDLRLCQIYQGNSIGYMESQSWCATDTNFLKTWPNYIFRSEINSNLIEINNLNIPSIWKPLHRKFIYWLKDVRP